MTALSRYEDRLYYLPEEEREALREMMFLEDEPENVALSVIQQMNRSKRSIKKGWVSV